MKECPDKQAVKTPEKIFDTNRFNLDDSLSSPINPDVTRLLSSLSTPPKHKDMVKDYFGGSLVDSYSLNEQGQIVELKMSGGDLSEDTLAKVVSTFSYNAELQAQLEELQGHADKIWSLEISGDTVRVRKKEDGNLLGIEQLLENL